MPERDYYLPEKVSQRLRERDEQYAVQRERNPLIKPDRHVEAVRAKLTERARVGLAKYGVTTERDNLSTRDWLIHAQEEALDLAVYLERLIQDLGDGSP